MSTIAKQFNIKEGKKEGKENFYYCGVGLLPKETMGGAGYYSKDGCFGFGTTPELAAKGFVDMFTRQRKFVIVK